MAIKIWNKKIVLMKGLTFQMIKWDDSSTTDPFTSSKVNRHQTYITIDLQVLVVSALHTNEFSIRRKAILFTKVGSLIQTSCLNELVNERSKVWTIIQKWFEKLFEKPLLNNCSILWMFFQQWCEQLFKQTTVKQMWKQAMNWTNNHLIVWMWKRKEGGEGKNRKMTNQV